MEDLKKEKLNILIEEYKITSDRIEKFLSSQKHFFFYGLTIVFGLLGIFQDHQEVLLALPIVVFIYVGLFLYHYQRIVISQLYKEKIENKINALCDEKLIFFTELGFRKIEKTNKFIIFNILSYSVLIIISIIAFITYFTGTNNTVNEIFIIATAIVLGILLILFIIALLDMPTKIKKTINEYIPDLLGTNTKGHKSNNNQAAKKSSKIFSNL